MTVESERRAYSLFREAAELDERGRARFLDEACGADARLRAEVERLLSARSSMGGFLARDAADLVRADEERVPDVEPGAEIGAYRVVRRLGAGAAGTVYEAVQARPQRRVALKVLRAGFASAKARRRFLDEAEVLARLDHPGIARIFEAGVHRAEGVELPFFAIEFVEAARPIDVHARDAGLDHRRKAALLADVCDAVHHGHQKGVLHRDLKPANVLVGTDDHPKVIDFGIAREVDAGEPSGLAGTVAYMSPEQADPTVADLDVRCDVYALGAVLFELLAGRPPHDVESLPLVEAVRRVRSESPTPLPPGVHRDLAAIVRKATAAAREDRYASASAMADDLRRHLRHLPVEAVDGGGLYRVGKFARRQSVAFASIVAVVVVSVAAAAVGTRLALEARRERLAAEFHAYVADVAAASGALRLNDVAGARTHLERAPERLRNWEWRHLAAALDTSERTWRWPGHFLRTGVIDASGRRIAAGGEVRTAPDQFAWFVRASDVETGDVLWTEPLVGRADALAFSPDGRSLAVGRHDGAIEMRDAATGALRNSLAGAGAADRPIAERHVNAVAFSADGRLLATGSGDRSIRLWDVATGGLVRTISDRPERVICLAFVARSGRLAAGLRDGSILILESATGETVRLIRAHSQSVEGLAVSPDGARMASVSRDRTVRIWDLADGREIASAAPHDDNVRDVAFSPSGTMIATASWDRTVALLDAADGHELARLRGHADNVVRVAFLPGGTRIVSFSRDETVKTWRADTDHDVPSLKGHSDCVSGLGMDASGRLLVSASGPRENHGIVWDVRERRAVARFDHKDPIFPVVAVWPDGSRFAVADTSKPVEIRALPSCEVVAALTDAFGPIALAPVADRLYAVSSLGSISVRNADSGAQVDSWDVGRNVTGLAVSGDERRLAVGVDTGFVTIWDVATHALVARRRLERRSPASLCFSPSGDALAVCDRTATVVLLRGDDLETIGALVGHAAEVNAARWSPDGTRIATASQDATLRLWDAATLDSVAVLDAHRAPVLCLAFSADGRTLVSGGGHAEVPGAILLWAAPELKSEGVAGRR